jgi:hypothetical protein
VAKAGITKTLRVGRDDTDVRADMKDAGITLVFIDPAFLHRRNDQTIGEEPPILSELTMILQHPKIRPYQGPLPFDLKRENSRANLRERFGPPRETNDEFRWDRWNVDDLVLTATYAKDLKSLQRVTVGIPGSE